MYIENLPSPDSISNRGIKLHKIIYSSPNKIEWDAQSAFKITNYYTEQEDHMVFCYLKQYVSDGNLKICTYCFDSQAHGKKDIQLCLNPNPVKTSNFFHIEFGIDGINRFELVNPETKDIACLDADVLQYHSFRTNDQQGYYWCGEITVSAELIKEYFCTFLCEKSIVLLNFYKIFENSQDHASLFPDSENDIMNKHNTMEEFIVLNY